MHTINVGSEAGDRPLDIDITRRSLFALLSLLPMASLAADPFPYRSVRLVVPVPPGGPTDSLARVLAAKMALELGQPVIVENHTGAAGLIGAAQVAKAPADGYTMLLGFGGIISISPGLYKKMPLDPLRELDPVTMLTAAPLMMVGQPGKLDSLEDLFGAARRGDQPSFGSSGEGSAMHLTGELFARSAKVRLTHVPYRGSAPALQDLLGGSLDLAISDLPFYLPYVKDGRIKGIAVTGPRRHPLLPDVPTFEERGVRGLEGVVSWQGLFVTAGVPSSAADRIKAAAMQAMRSPEIRGSLIGQGYDVDTTSGLDFRTFIVADTKRWGEVIREAGIQMTE